MKIPTQTNYLLRPCLAMALALAIGSPIQLQSASHAEGKGMMMDSKMMNKCQEIKKKKQQMQAKMKAQDAELTAAVACMNRAPQDKKLNLVADVVTQLVEQRKAMHAKKTKMQEKMMQHMMRHMQMGKKSMSKCPIMKGMDEKSTDAHKRHHPE